MPVIRQSLHRAPTRSGQTIAVNQSIYRLILCGVMLFAGCDKPTGGNFKIDQGGVTHIDGCNVAVHRIEALRDVRRVRVQFACGVSATSTKDAKWWGDQPQPLMFTVDWGDCMLMQETYYCLEDFQEGSHVTFRAMYRKPKHPAGNLERIR